MVTRRAQGGFTATEVLVVIAIVGILAAFAFPSMKKLLTTQSVRTAAYDVLADLTYARSEAIARGVNVVMAGNTTTNWLNGWTITETGGNTVLRQQSARGGAMTFTASVSSVTFDRTGRVQMPNPVSFSIVPTDPSATNDQKRCITLSPSGRPKSTNGACA